MASLLFVAFGAVLAVVSVLLSRRQPMWARKRKWWELTHSKDSVKPLRVGFALQELKSGWWPARSLVIVRVRQPGAAPRVWIGTSAEKDDVVAHHVAEAAGCVATQCAPPTGIARASGWRISYVRSNGASGDSKVPRPGNDYLKGLAANLNAHLDGGDAMVLTLIPCRDKARVKARAAIRARSLRNSWADRAKTSRFLPLPSIVGFVHGLFAVFCVLRVVEEFTVFDFWIFYPVSEVSVLTAALFAATWVFGLPFELWPTRRIRLLAKYWHFPPGLLLRARDMPISGNHIAGWAKAK